MGTRRTWTNVFPLVLSKHDTFYVFFSSVVYSSFASRLHCREDGQYYIRMYHEIIIEVESESASWF